MTYFLNKCLKILLSSLQKLNGVGGGGDESFTTCPYRNSNLQKFAYSIAAFFFFFSQNKLQLHVEELREGGRGTRTKK